MKKNFLLKAILWIVQGFIVGLGAILPGVSGGTLCYAFGIYEELCIRVVGVITYV